MFDISLSSWMTELTDGQRPVGFHCSCELGVIYQYTMRLVCDRSFMGGQMFTLSKVQWVLHINNSIFGREQLVSVNEDVSCTNHPYQKA